MINRVILIGRLTKDPELKYTSSGAAVGSFNLAVNRQFTNANGDREADFINCVIWRKSAENFANFTHKGSLVGIDGRLQTRNYENNQGQRIYVTEVVVDNFSLLEKRASDNSNANQTQAGSNQTQSKPTDPFAGNGQAIDINDDDLPF
ncbi:single-stranded DNA-binding protein [Latilactobacillus sakei]|nr:single-stranded DNA-binding protein [Latilactobacillus sakei]